MTGQSPSDQGFPHISEQFVDDSQYIRRSWRQLLLTLWQRTGGTGGTGTVITGTVIDFAGTITPGGWLVCDGSEVSRQTYANLFSIIGTVWGAGDGNSTFNLPNLSNRFTMGVGANVLGAHGGTSALALSVSQLPAHNHIVDDPGHTHTVTDPGHVHAVTDPGHTHTVTDPHHTHTVTDPTHTHGITDPGHVHTSLVNANDLTVGIVAGGSAAGNTGSATTGITVNAAATGVTNATAATGITNNSATTGLTVNSHTTGVTNASAMTGVTTEDTGTGATISINPPYAVLQKIIKT